MILGAKLQLEADDPQELSQRLQKQWIIRKASQPMGHQCAGCVFKNPRGVSAGELIERAGLERHANRRRRGQRPSRQLHRRRVRVHQPATCCG